MSEEFAPGTRVRFRYRTYEGNTINQDFHGVRTGTVVREEPYIATWSGKRIRVRWDGHPYGAKRESIVNSNNIVRIDP